VLEIGTGRAKSKNERKPPRLKVNPEFPGFRSHEHCANWELSWERNNSVDGNRKAFRGTEKAKLA
jgi:hypothetical protein